MIPVWKFFFDKQVQKNPAKVPEILHPSKISVDKHIRQQLLRGRYGSAKNSLFSSKLASFNDDTVSQLQSLHPKENFHTEAPLPPTYWRKNSILFDQFLILILKLPSGKAPGPSGITFDILKSVCIQNSLIVDDLCDFFNDILLLKVVAPKELSASRLVDLVKPNKIIRPIAVGELIYRLFSSLVFSRILNKAQKYFSPFQYGIKTIDGVSVAALTSDLFLNTKTDNFVLNLDFKNAFNSVKRAAILPQSQEHFPELESFFHTFYGNSSDLVYNSTNLSSLTGVKQGDPLGPFFFCLAIHPILNYLKSKYKDLEIVANMDAISFIAPFETIQAISAEAATLYEKIGLNLNIHKCFVIGKEPKLLTIRSIEVPFISYSASSFRFLGCFFLVKRKILSKTLMII
ncbi:hypothetical protein GEMRC1_007787 [Eukaryota sp. GEM-RC1]